MWEKTTQYQTWRKLPKNPMGPQTFTNSTSQTPNIKLELTKRQTTYALSTNLNNFSLCASRLNVWKTYLQYCRTTLKVVYGVVISQEDNLVCLTEKKAVRKETLAVRGWLRQKQFSFNGNKPLPRPANSNNFLKYSRIGMASNHKYVERSKKSKPTADSKKNRIVWCASGIIQKSDSRFFHKNATSKWHYV